MKNLMVRIKAFFTSPWAHKAYRIVEIIGGVVIVVLMALGLIRAVFKAKEWIEGALGIKSAGFYPIPNDPTHISMNVGQGRTQVVELPKDSQGKQVTSDKITAAGVDQDGQIVVKVLSERVDVSKLPSASPDNPNLGIG